MNAPGHIARLVRAIVEGLSVDWAGASRESAADTEQRELVNQLRVISAIAALHRTRPSNEVFAGQWGHLRVVELIGQGTYGDVYRAVDTRLDREVALKLMRSGADASEARNLAAMEEARLLARVQHPNVVTIHGADSIDGRVGLWMEYVRGRTLEQVLTENGPLPAPDVAAVCADVCRALAVVHEAGLVHRDIKAHNVMEDARGRRVLMDFGAGRTTFGDGAADLTGTPLYLAPEVLNGESASERSDLYSVGVLLFHLASGRYPVEGRSLAEIKERHATHGRVRLRALRPDYPEAVSGLIDRALSPVVSERFESAGAMADAAARVLAPRSVRASWRRTTGIVLLTLALAAASWKIAGRGWWAGGITARVVWEDAVDLGGTTSADGRWLSFADRDTGNLAVRDLVSGRTSIVTHTGYAAGGAAERSAISPDGKWIAYDWFHLSSPGHGADAGIDLRVIGADGSQDRLVERFDQNVYVEPQAWSPDGRWIALSVARASGWSIEIVSSDGERKWIAVALGDDAPSAVRVSPDGRWLAIHQERKACISLARADGSSTVPIRVADASRLVAWTMDGRLLFTREEGQSADMYVLPVANGVASGEAAKITTIADIGQPLGLTTSGSLIYGKTKSSGLFVYGTRTFPAEVVAVSIDRATGALGPEHVTQRVTAYGTGGLAGGVRYSPDRLRVMYTPTQGTILIRAADGAARTLVPPLDLVGRVEWAPDGRSLIVNGRRTAGEGGIYRIDLETGAPSLLFAPPKVATAHALSPDGRTLYVGYGLDSGGRVVARDLQTGAEREVRRVESGASALRPSRDGRMLAIVTAPAVEIVDLGTGSTVLRMRAQPDAAQFWGGDWSPDYRYFLSPMSYGGTPARGELWRIPIDGTPPLRHPLTRAARGLSMRPDGTELSMVRWEERQQVWKLDSFLPAVAMSR